ncbi:MAG: hypothetical protein GC165_00670 [Armatimonadetes bacterium]|nr:hypothetical protein [Armatimonadota bacterium]
MARKVGSGGGAGKKLYRSTTTRPRFVRETALKELQEVSAKDSTMEEIKKRLSTLENLLVRLANGQAKILESLQVDDLVSEFTDVHLTKKQSAEIVKLPESSMGAHLMRITLKSGEVLNNIPVIESTWARIPESDSHLKASDFAKFEAAPRS